MTLRPKLSFLHCFVSQIPSFHPSSARSLNRSCGVVFVLRLWFWRFRQQSLTYSFEARERHRDPHPGVVAQCLYNLFRPPTTAVMTTPSTTSITDSVYHSITNLLVSLICIHFLILLNFFSSIWIYLSCFSLICV